MRIGPGIDKGRQALHAKRSEDEHLADVQNCGHYCIGQMSRPHPGGKTDREADDRQHQRGAQVRLFRDQSRDDAKHEKARQERSPERNFVARSFLDEARQN